jgi:hypothetical protein
MQESIFYHVMKVKELVIDTSQTYL